MALVRRPPTPEHAAAIDPIHEFETVFARAARGAPFDPTAVVLATADPGGRPSARVVLLKGVDERGFRFYTNYQSRKGGELAANPNAALCFYWPWIDEQARIEGPVERLEPTESDTYFALRPRGHQLGAWASPQSRPIRSRFALLRGVATTALRFAGRPVERPPHWGGFLLRPERIELWRARADRLHERRHFVAGAEGWTIERLAP